MGELFVSKLKGGGPARDSAFHDQCVEKRAVVESDADKDMLQN